METHAHSSLKLLGARLLPRMRGRALRLVFAGVVVVLAAEMLYKGLTGRL